MLKSNDVNAYEKLNLIGEGSFSHVYKAIKKY